MRAFSSPARWSRLTASSGAARVVPRRHAAAVELADEVRGARLLLVEGQPGELAPTARCARDRRAPVTCAGHARRVAATPGSPGPAPAGAGRGVELAALGAGALQVDGMARRDGVELGPREHAGDVELRRRSSRPRAGTATGRRACVPPGRRRRAAPPCACTARRSAASARSTRTPDTHAVRWASIRPGSTRRPPRSISRVVLSARSRTSSSRAGRHDHAVADGQRLHGRPAVVHRGDPPVVDDGVRRIRRALDGRAAGRRRHRHPRCRDGEHARAGDQPSPHPSLLTVARPRAEARDRVARLCGQSAYARTSPSAWTIRPSTIVRFERMSLILASGTLK